MAKETLTVLEAINLSTDYLVKKGIEDARLNVQIFLAHLLKCTRIELYVNFQKPLTEKETTELRDFISRRGKHEPLQYIVGSTEFFGMNLTVNKSVLIPRPETELLVESVIDTVSKNFEGTILDIGTGSGAISIALAKQLNKASITTIDVNSDALTVAKENANLNQCQNIDFLNGDLFTYSFNSKFDVVVSNPPYISIEESKNLQPEIVLFEPQNAYTDFGDGYKFYDHIITKADTLLGPDGKVFLEIGEGQSYKINDLLSKNKFKNVQIVKDYQGIDRIIFADYL